MYSSLLTFNSGESVSGFMTCNIDSTLFNILQHNGCNEDKTCLVVSLGHKVILVHGAHPQAKGFTRERGLNFGRNSVQSWTELLYTEENHSELYLFDSCRIEIFSFHIGRDCLPDCKIVDKGRKEYRKCMNTFEHQILTGRLGSMCPCALPEWLCRECCPCRNWTNDPRVLWDPARSPGQGTKLTASHRSKPFRQDLGPSRSLVLGVPLVQRFCAAAWKLPGLLTRFPVVVNLFARRVGIIFLDLARWLVASGGSGFHRGLQILQAASKNCTGFSWNLMQSRYIKIYQDAIKQAKKLGKLLGRPQNTNSFRLRRKHHANGLTGQTHTWWRIWECLDLQRKDVGPMTKWSMLRQHCDMLMY